MSEADIAAWLRQRIAQRKYLAEHAIALGNAAEWTELSSGVLMTIAPDAPQDRRDGVHPLGDSSLTRLMEANDPQDTIARCEAELAILDELAAAKARQESEARDYASWVAGENLAPRPAFTGPSPVLIAGLEAAVRLLASGYRHQPGYQEE